MSGVQGTEAKHPADDEPAGTSVEYAIEWHDGATPKTSRPFNTYAEAAARLRASAFTGRVVRRLVTTTAWEEA